MLAVSVVRAASKKGRPKWSPTLHLKSQFEKAELGRAAIAMREGRPGTWKPDVLKKRLAIVSSLGSLLPDETKSRLETINKHLFGHFFCLPISYSSATADGSEADVDSMSEVDRFHAEFITGSALAAGLARAAEERRGRSWFGRQPIELKDVLSPYSVGQRFTAIARPALQPSTAQGHPSGWPCCCESACNRWEIWFRDWTIRPSRAHPCTGGL